MPDLLAASYGLEDASCWLSPSGARLYLAAVWGRWVFIRVYDMAECRIRTLVSLRTPEDLERPRIVAEEGSLWIVDCRARLLELSTSTWEVLSWRSQGGVCAPGEELHRAIFTPSTRTLWFSVSGSSAGEVRSLRLGTKGEAPRTLGEARNLMLLPGRDGLRVLTTAPGEGRVFSAEGALLQELGGGLEIVHGAEAPTDTGIVLLTSIEEAQQPMLGLVHVAADGAPGEPLLVDGSSSLRTSNLATSREARLVFVRYCGERRDPWLVAFSATARGIEQSFRLPVEPEVTLAQDVSARWVVLLTPTDEDTAVLVLGREAPQVTGADKGEVEVHKVATPNLCWCGLPPISEHLAAQARAVTTLPAGERDDALAELLLAPGQDADTLLVLGAAFEQLPHPERGTVGAHCAWERYPESPAVERPRAGVDAGAGEWKSALARLERIEAAPLSRRQRCHLHHLRGFAYYHLGRPQEALEELRRGAPLDDGGACRLQQWIPHVAGALEPVPREAPGPDQAYVDQLITAILAADRLLDRGEAARAAKVLDRWAMWRCDDLQGLARLAQVWLLRDPPTEEDRFRKALVLAAFAQRQASPTPGFQLGIPPESIWDDAQLARLARYSREWLERAG